MQYIKLVFATPYDQNLRHGHVCQQVSFLLAMIFNISKNSNFHLILLESIL